MPARFVPIVWLWLGAALLFTAVVAPAAFAVLPSRALAGLLVGRVLPVLFWSGAVVGLVIAASAGGWRRAAALTLLASALGAQWGIAPRIERARQAIGPELERVAADDPRRVAFGRLHGFSVMLLGLGMLAAGAVAVGELFRPGVSPRQGSAVPLRSPASSLPSPR